VAGQLDEPTLDHPVHGLDLSDQACTVHDLSQRESAKWDAGAREGVATERLDENDVTVCAGFDTEDFSPRRRGCHPHDPDPPP
jgi:hypothetical protein